ncbi:hypothetical protein CRENBAI_004222 [Crenichthys baileyi]|uniref:Uncharacterized protein n=1 Tax=Crenichthys baileyi TaxID=28760 RepID=A0AAV9SNN1_9TELE
MRYKMSRKIRGGKWFSSRPTMTSREISLSTPGFLSPPVTKSPAAMCRFDCSQRRASEPITAQTNPSAHIHSLDFCKTLKIPMNVLLPVNMQDVSRVNTK